MTFLTSFRLLLAHANKGRDFDVWSATVLTGNDGDSISSIAHRDVDGTAITQATAADQPTIDSTSITDLVQANFGDGDNLTVTYSGNVLAIGLVIDKANSGTRPLASRLATSNDGWVVSLIDDPA